MGLRADGLSSLAYGPEEAYLALGEHSSLRCRWQSLWHFKNIVFVSIAVIDSGRFKGLSEIESLSRMKEDDLKSFVDFANCLGWYAEYRYGLGIDLMDELEKLCKSVATEFPRSVFFAGKLVFQEENFLTRLLHNHTPFTLEQRLQFEGHEMMVLPVRVFASAAGGKLARELPACG